jgi:malonyl-CoA O-methyltransferase
MLPFLKARIALRKAVTRHKWSRYGWHYCSTLKDVAQSDQDSSVLQAVWTHFTVPRSMGVHRAIGWARRNEHPGGGIRAHNRYQAAYPEVTGYFIPTLLDCGEVELAVRCARWLMGVQGSDGSFREPWGGIRPYIFDTGQALRGLLSVADLVPGARDAARLAAGYLCREALEGGRGGFNFRDPQEGKLGTHLYVLPPLMQSAVLFGEKRYSEVAERCLDHYRARQYELRIDDLTHFLAYRLEALIDLGRADLAVPVLHRLRQLQTTDGAVRGIGGADWVCSPGLAQLAICWYKTGEAQTAGRALDWLDRDQLPCGGFFGSYGPGADYFPDVVPAWVVKFYLDACRHRLLSYVEKQGCQATDVVPCDDACIEVLAGLVDVGRKVIQVGCGQGAWLKALHQRRPSAHYAGHDLSARLLTGFPPYWERTAGSLEHIPHPDESFDVTFSFEPHLRALSFENSIREMVRITRPGGRVVVMARRKPGEGALGWQLPLESRHLEALLEKGCENLTARTLPANTDSAAPPTFLWVGRRRPSGPARTTAAH